MDADTVDLFPETISFPNVTTDQYLRQAATDILTILQSPKKNTPSLTYGSAVTNAYVQIAQILKLATIQTETTKIPILHYPTSLPPEVTLLGLHTPTPPAPPRVQFQDSAPDPRVTIQPTIRIKNNFSLTSKIAQKNTTQL